MNWISNFVRPRIKSLMGRSSAPDNLWRKCTGCGEMIFHRDLQAADSVCPQCGHHMRLGARDRFARLFDNGAHDVLPNPEVPQDPLRFRDDKRYSDRLKEYRTRTAQTDALLAARGLARRDARHHRGAELRLHGRLARSCHGCGPRRRHADRGQREAAVHPDRLVRRRAHAGGNPLADADAAHHRRREHAERGGATLHRRADRSDDRRRVRVLRHARRRADRASPTRSSASPARA